MTAARTNRRLLIALAAIGVVAGVVGIGASIVGVDTEAERSEADQASTAPLPDAPTEPEEEPAVPAEPTEPPVEEPAAEPTEEEEAALEAQLEAEAAITRARAEEIAQGEVAGPVDRSRISDETGTPVWEVRIDGDSGHTDVQVDATTGQVLAVDD